MSNALIAPEYELFPNRYRWTVQACNEMAAEGRLIGRYEILDGEVVSKMGQKPAHAAALTRLMNILFSLFGATCIRIQAPIAIPGPDGLYNEPEPDAAITHEPVDAYADRHPGPEDLLLVVEVSDTTLRTDLIVKARLYARAGIPEYWSLDLSGRQLVVHREPVEGEYTAVSVHAEMESVSPVARPNAQIAIADLLPADA